jgi:hypothetical protein
MRSAPPLERTRFPTTPDGWEVRLRLALRLRNGAVFTARQCEQLAAALGWKRDEPTTPAA